MSLARAARKRFGPGQSAQNEQAMCHGRSLQLAYKLRVLRRRCHTFRESVPRRLL
jgi:hypothetical protein